MRLPPLVTHSELQRAMNLLSFSQVAQTRALTSSSLLVNGKKTRKNDKQLTVFLLQGGHEEALYAYNPWRRQLNTVQPRLSHERASCGIAATTGSTSLRARQEERRSSPRCCAGTPRPRGCGGTSPAEVSHHGSVTIRNRTPIFGGSCLELWV